MLQRSQAPRPARGQSRPGLTPTGGRACPWPPPPPQVEPGPAGASHPGAGTTGSRMPLSRSRCRPVPSLGSGCDPNDVPCCGGSAPKPPPQENREDHRCRRTSEGLGAPTRTAAHLERRLLPARAPGAGLGSPDEVCYTQLKSQLNPLAWR